MVTFSIGIGSERKQTAMTKPLEEQSDEELRGALAKGELGEKEGRRKRNSASPATSQSGGVEAQIQMGWQHRCCLQLVGGGPEAILAQCAVDGATACRRRSSQQCR